ncbi:AYR1 [Candida metapsilosis]|uniref:AYR1 n=1 Tax=Candida metapsilosis TaxID=273372 RepID=A0A8H8D9J9_9ASCO|nr:AYR1 [Candida metapsilosis]
MSEKRQKIALVTGASSGIGFATSIELAKRGYVVFAGARRLEPMAKLRDNYGVKIFKLDITDPQSITEARTYIQEQSGGSYLDILYNNAGQICTSSTTDVTDQDLEQTFEVNVLGAIRMVREFVPLLINAKGVIGFTGSIAGFNPIPFQSIYNSSKAAIDSYAATLRIEMDPFGVKVINFVSGGVKTNIEGKSTLPASSLFNVPGMDEAYEEVRLVVSKNDPMSPEVYAKQVADDFEKAKLGGSFHLYRGKSGILLGFIGPLFPRWIREAMFVSSLKLKRPFEYLRKKYASGITD